MIPGPQSIALWPQQYAKVIQGHRLRSNQYLVARVYNAEQAELNFATSAIRFAITTDAPHIEAALLPTKEVPPAGRVDSSSDVSQSTQLGIQPPEQQPLPVAGATPPTPPPPSSKDDGKSKQPKFAVGQLLIICGTQVSFFIPPTGVEVVADESGQYVRDAVTLEQLEYCILLSEGGEKRYVYGPDVVFPEPTETFMTDDQGNRKFKATELNPDMGLHLKVTKGYVDGTQRHEQGEELFITGRTTRIYYPRAEHAPIKYGSKGNGITYAIALPEGDARYVWEKDKERVVVVRGPKSFLPDPRTQVVVQRVLTDQQCRDWFPDSTSALQFNQMLQQQSMVAQGAVSSDLLGSDERMAMRSISSRVAARAFSPDTFDRGESYTPPRTITLDSKFQGAVHVAPYSGYAVLVVSKDGEQRVIVGPKGSHLDFDETLQVLTLSKGRPKNADRTVRTVYLHVKNNRVSDQIEVTTSDMIDVTIDVAYRVTFEGESEADRLKWFEVTNYVQFLCDHLRSLLKRACRAKTIQELINHTAEIVRDTILGVAKEPGGDRPGRKFTENGMRVYEVEVLGTNVVDNEVRSLIADQQFQVVQATLELAREAQDAERQKRSLTIAAGLREAQDADDVTAQAKERERIARQEETATKRREADLKDQDHQDSLQNRDLARAKKAADQDVAIKTALQAIEIALLTAQADTLKTKAGAIQPGLIEALQALGDSELLDKVASQFNLLSIFKDSGVLEIAAQLFEGTAIGERIKQNASKHRGELPSGGRPSSTMR